MNVRTFWNTAAIAVLACAALAACDQKLASQPARDHRSVDDGQATGVASAGETTTSAPAAARVERADASSSARVEATPVKLVEGKPMWSDNRRHTAQENAEYQFEHHGQELGAKSLDDFVLKAHRFVNDPPATARTITRANGDRLLYDPKSGLFGVVRSDGAPRTVTRPDDGQAFWDKQVAENRDGGTTRGVASRSRSGGDS
jgi:pyocin large subunit-like protein